MKNKCIIYVFFLFIVLGLNIHICEALVYHGKITGNGVYLRSGPGTNYDTLKTLSKDGEYNLVNNELIASEQECANGWYKMYYEGSATGYVCSDYVQVIEITYNEVPTNDCEVAMQDAGFPPSYWSGLCSLKSAHPNWTFQAIATGLLWSEAVSRESACGNSYIASSVPTNIDYTCKNQYTKTWYPASSSAVAYYMDPRNFFTEQAIFQFEYLKYDSNLESLYAGAAADIIDHTEFYKYHLTLNNLLGDIINLVGKDTNVSPIFIASRILQEMGSSNSLYNLYSGIYPGYEGFYNFYNFGVTDSCATSKGTTICGLDYAKSKNWYGLTEAIKGGASQIASSYIDKGQYTGYLQKFNVVPIEASKLYGHQYMTNIGAPSSEAKTTYNTYKNLGLLDNVFAFYIPVYINMDESDYQSSSGAVDTPDTENKTAVPISTIVVSSGFKYASGMITGINPNTDVNTVKNTLESIAGAKSVLIKNSQDVLVTEGLIGTGYKISVSNSEMTEDLVVVINGDTSGDGIINALDLLQVQKNILGTFTLSGVYSLAGDTSDDGIINALDLLQVQKNLLGTYTIVQ